MNIRHATVDDAERLAALILQVESESDYLLFEAGERKLAPEQQRSHLEAITNEDNATILLAETDEGELVGYLLARGGFARRNRHSVYIVIGLLAAFRGKGMGTMYIKRESEVNNHHDGESSGKAYDLRRSSLLSDARQILFSVKKLVQLRQLSSQANFFSTWHIPFLQQARQT
ncbi:GNAT family N-acetyltransferase, partial [Anoxybacillus voinovskiensis]